MLATVFITVASVLAYISFIPQIVKLIKTKTSAGVSAMAYLVTTVCYMCHLAYAILVRDVRLSLSVVGSLLLTVWVLYLTLRYAKREGKKNEESEV